MTLDVNMKLENTVNRPAIPVNKKGKIEANRLSVSLISFTSNFIDEFTNKSLFDK